MENKKLLFHIPRENKEDFQSIMNSVDMNELYKAEDKMKQLESNTQIYFTTEYAR